MKGIIAEIDEKQMIVITEKGDFVKQRLLKGYKVGDEILISKQSPVHFRRQLTAIAASFILLAMLVTGVYAYNTPYSYVSVDINPSLGLTVNIFDIVIGVDALNAEAESLISSTAHIKNTDIEKAVEEILNKAYESGYLKKDSENSVMLVVSTKDKKEEEKLLTELGKTSAHKLSSISSTYNVVLEKTDVKEYKQAVSEKISPGKLILADKIKEVNPAFKNESVKDMSVSQAIEIIRNKGEENKGAKTAGNKEDEENVNKGRNENKKDEEDEDDDDKDEDDKRNAENKQDDDEKKAEIKNKDDFKGSVKKEDKASSKSKGNKNGNTKKNNEDDEDKDDKDKDISDKANDDKDEIEDKESEKGKDKDKDSDKGKGKDNTSSSGTGTDSSGSGASADDESDRENDDESENDKDKKQDDKEDNKNSKNDNKNDDKNDDKNDNKNGNKGDSPKEDNSEKDDSEEDKPEEDNPGKGNNNSNEKGKEDNSSDELDEDKSDEGGNGKGKKE
ncbi:MAG: anti-sigma-I factor RsgI family protein [Bacillota bacterium]